MRHRFWLARRRAEMHSQPESTRPSQSTVEHDEPDADAVRTPEHDSRATLQKRLRNQSLQRLAEQRAVAAFGGNESGKSAEQAPPAAAKKAKGGRYDFGSPISGATERFYEIREPNLSKVASHFKFGNGERHASETYVGVGLASKPSLKRTEGQLILEPLKWKPVGEGGTGRPIVHLPRWANFKSATPTEKAEWARFVRHLRMHEQGHVDRAEELMANAPKAWHQVTGKDRPSVKKALDDLQSHINDLVAARFAKYDAETNHGATQSATLKPP